MKNARHLYVHYAKEIAERAAIERRLLTHEEMDLVKRYDEQVSAIDMTEQLIRERESSEHGSAS